MVKDQMGRKSGDNFLVKALFSSASERKLEMRVCRVTELRLAEEGNYFLLPSKFGATRRMAICSAIEEEDRSNGRTLAELRRNLIVCHTLEKVGLL